MRELLYSSDVPILNSNVVRPPLLNKSNNGLTTKEGTPPQSASTAYFDMEKSATSKKKRKKRKNKGDTVGSKPPAMNETADIKSSSFLCSINAPSASKSCSSNSTDPEYFTSLLSGSVPMLDVKLDTIERVVKCVDLSDIENVKRLTILERGVIKPQVSRLESNAQRSCPSRLLIAPISLTVSYLFV